MDNHHKEVGKLALDALDAKAQVDDLLKPAHDVNTSLERVQETADREHNLLKPTDERVRETIQGLRHERWNSEFPFPENYIDDAATLLETLLTENKALREKCRQIEITAEMLADQYNPSTHVAVPREPTEGRLISMAMRIDHAFGLHSERQQAVAISDMRKAYVEATGQGFYTEQNEDWYAGHKTDRAEDYADPLSMLTAAEEEG